MPKIEEDDLKGIFPFKSSCFYLIQKWGYNDMIGQTISTHAAHSPNKAAIITKNETITYEVLHFRISQIKASLVKKLGTEKGKRIGLLIGNDPSFIEVFFAVSSLGWIAIPFDPKWTQKEMIDIIDECRPDLLIIGSSFEHMTFENSVHVQELYKTHLSPHISEPQNEQLLFYIGYTSGSTGRPKGFMRHHLSWLKSFAGCEIAFQISKDDVIYAPGPFCHSFSLFAAIHTIHMGATFYLSEKFNATEGMNTIENQPISVIYFVPTMLHALTSEYIKQNLTNHTVKKIISSGAKWSADLKATIKEVFRKAQQYEFYGASELSFITYLDGSGNEKKPDSVGLPFPGVDIFIEKDGEKAARGEIGKLYVKSDLIFSGYVNNPSETAKVIQGEYATVGDLAFQDDDGYITLVGREKNMIISGGLNIFPEEIEHALSRLDEVDEALAIGVKDEYWGEKLIALIKWKQGKFLTNEELKEYCRHTLSTYKCPKEFITVHAFPYTSSGKIARNKVVLQYHGCEVK